MNKLKDIEVSYYDTIKSSSPSIIGLDKVLFGDTYKDAVEKIRAISIDGKDEAELSDEEVKRLKDMRKPLKQSLPLFTPSGVFHGSNDGSIIQHSGLICIDFDLMDNRHLEDFSEFKESLNYRNKCPYICYCARSCSGTGFFVPLRIKDTSRHRQYYSSAMKYFEQVGLKADPSGINVGRKRFVSYDPEPYFNDDAKVFDLFYRDHPKAGGAVNPTTAIDTQDALRTMRKVIEKIEFMENRKVDITENYEDWLNVAFAFATTFGEEGRELFHRISRINDDYNDEEADKKYSDAIRNGRGKVTIGTFFELCKKNGAKADFFSLNFNN